MTKTRFKKSKLELAFTSKIKPPNPYGYKILSPTLNPLRNAQRGTRTLKSLRTLDFKSSEFTNFSIRAPKNCCSVHPRNDNST